MLDFVNKMVKTLFGDKHDKDIKAVLPLVDAANEEYKKLQNISNDELRGKTAQFKERIAEYLTDITAAIVEAKESITGNPDMDPDAKEAIYQSIDDLEKQHDEALEEVLQELLPEAFAVVKETARRFVENTTVTSTATQLDRDLSVTREHININGDQVTYNNSWMAAGSMTTWNMLHYDVQLVGGIVLHQGKIAEMATGEGKTLVATLPAYLNGLAGKGVHLVTVNNYLAKRDSEWMGPIFNFLGLTVDCIDNYRPNSPERRAAYNCDIVYGTNNEFGFDYLRDNMVRTPEELVQGKHHYAMIDEVDSVLIDDARTPLIISGPVEKGEEHQYDELKPRIQQLYNVQKKLATNLLIEAKKKIAEGNKDVEEGGGGLALLRAHRAMPKLKPLIKFFSETGTQQIMRNTENHYLQEQAKRMPEVDSELYFVIDEKQNQVELTEKGAEYLARENEDANFFVMPDIGGIIAEIENSDATEREKLAQKDAAMQEFAIKSERLHSVQQLLKAYTLFERDNEYIVDGDKVKIVDEQTGRVMEGRRYSDGLHQAIEAKENVKVEAATQTFATITLQNFFRMYHKLAGMTGTAETEAGEFWEIYELDVVVIPTNKPIVRKDMDDLVFRTAREKYSAVIEEVESLRAAGRPILVGTASVEVSELLSRLLNLKNISHNVLNAKQHAREADIVAEAGKAGNVTIATNMAGRGTDIKLGEGVKEAGGLAILGTERHDSRRVDRQLRGRAGRQGDPGSSQFFVSLEDALMRLFGSEKIARVMDKMGYQEGEVIQHSMISRSIEKAQKKVEENNFGIRKRLLDYDEVMNAQRTVIYAKRRHALFGERLSVDINNTFKDLCDEIVYDHKQFANHDDNAYEGFEMDVLRFLATTPGISETEFKTWDSEQIADKLYDNVYEHYKRKTQDIIKLGWPFIEQTYNDKSQVYKRVVFPFTDEQRHLQVVVDLEEAYNTKGKALAKALEKNISLAFIDNSWKEHLREMDQLKQAVQMATYEQKDPLLIYKKEAYDLFKGMVMEMNKELVAFLSRAKLPISNSDEVREARQPRRTDMSRMKTSREDDGLSGNAQQAAANREQGERQKAQPIKRDMPKIGRNDPCPCGSGKKYKNCHGKKGASL